MTVSVLMLFLTVPWVDLQCVILVFSDHTHLFFYLAYLAVGDARQLQSLEGTEG